MYFLLGFKKAFVFNHLIIYCVFSPFFLLSSQNTVLQLFFCALCCIFVSLLRSGVLKILRFLWGHFSVSCHLHIMPIHRYHIWYLLHFALRSPVLRNKPPDPIKSQAFIVITMNELRIFSCIFLFLYYKSNIFSLFKKKSTSTKRYKLKSKNPPLLPYLLSRQAG